MKDVRTANIRTAVIAGSIAVAAVIAAVVILIAGNSKNGLYITAVSGNVNISNSEKSTSENAAADKKLNKGDVVTVGEGGTCTLVYRTRRNIDTNYMMLTENSQVFVTENFDGKDDSELYLNRGTLISSNAEDLGACAIVRTSNCSVGTGCAVSIVKYSLSDEGNYTDFASLGGNLRIQLYDEHGTKVNKEEPLGSKRNGRVVSGADGPYFAFLNTDAQLSDYSAAELKALFSVSSYVQLEFSSAEIKEAYNLLHEDSGEAAEPLEDVTTPAGGELPIQTAETIATTLPSPDESESETTIITSESSDTSSETTTTTTASETTSQTTSETTSDTDITEDTEPDETDEEPDETEYGEEDEKFTVYIIVDDEISEQYVSYGENAVQPPDPYVEGKSFTGWDGSFDNITEDRTITALFSESDQPYETSETNGQSSSSHTVTVIIGDKTTTQTVNDGEAANIPSSITLEGYTFKGWDKDYSNVTSDMTVSAILEPINCNVTFIVDGVSYFTTVGYGESVSPPVSPSQNSAGQKFTGWDKSLSGITSDTTITAVFDTTTVTTATYTVTFIVDGVSYTQNVTSGQSASAPIPPDVNAQGQTFIGWDRDYSNITSNVTVNAVYA